MAIAYNSPGVIVSESVNPALAPLISNPQVIAIVGPASGSQTASERLILTGTTAVQLKYTGISTGSVVVLNAASGITVNPGSYTIVQGTDPDATVTGDEPYTVARKTMPTVALTAANAGTGTLVGTYVYAHSYVNASGETGIGPASNAVTFATQGGNLSAISVGPTGTTARNVYRKKTSTGGDGKYHLVATINDNTGTTVTNETTSDATAQGDGVTTFGTAQPVQGIADGDTIVISYSYTDSTYYTPTMLPDFASVVTKYGPPFDANGAVSSALSFAARLAFLNGASEVMGVAATTSAQTDLDAGLAKLEGEPGVRIVVTTGGTASNASSLAAHITKTVNQGLYRIGVAGVDGSATVFAADTIRSAATGLNNEGVRLINASSFRMTNPVTGRNLNIGGQYAAAAIAGMYAGRDVQIPLTRKSVAGFDGINDVRTASDLALDSAKGLLVIENRGGVLRVRHDITTATGSVNSAEASVVRAKYEMAARLRATLDASIIGAVLPREQAPLAVQSAVTGVLEQLINEGVVNGYSDVTALALSDPTTIQCRFQYTPAYPINNIAIIFTIDTSGSSSDFTLVSQ